MKGRDGVCLEERVGGSRGVVPGFREPQEAGAPCARVDRGSLEGLQAHGCRAEDEDTQGRETEAPSGASAAPPGVIPRELESHATKRDRAAVEFDEERTHAPGDLDDGEGIGHERHAVEEPLHMHEGYVPDRGCTRLEAQELELSGLVEAFEEESEVRPLGFVLQVMERAGEARYTKTCGLFPPWQETERASSEGVDGRGALRVGRARRHEPSKKPFLGERIECLLDGIRREVEPIRDLLRGEEFMASERAERLGCPGRTRDEK